MNLFPQHDVAFSVHHQLLVNLLAFDLVASVEAVAVVLDSVSIPGAHVLVPVLVHLVSTVVMVLDVIAVVVDPFVILVCVIETRTVSVAAVFSGPAVWVHHVWSAHLDRLLQFSSASLSAGDAISQF